MPDRLRCRLHGGLAGRPPGTPMHPNTAAALRAGQARWLEKMHALKASGLIAKFPQGRKPGVPGRARSADRTIARAQRALEEVVMANRKPTVPMLPSDEALPARPCWDEMSEGEKLGVATGLALDIVKEILALGIDPTDPKMVGHVKDTALHVISMKIRVDESRMRQPASDGLIEYEAAVARQERLLGLRPEKPKPKKEP